MNMQFTPTKGNLLSLKKSLSLAKLGFDLLDKKRNILIREMLTLIDKAYSIQEKIDLFYSDAYAALQRANITLGICDEIAGTVPEEKNLNLSYRSIMGVEIPILSLQEKNNNNFIPFGLYSTNSSLDEAYLKFSQVKNLTVILSEIENSVYRLADAIKKTQKRANALKNILIPRFENAVATISDTLEEKSRENFSRLKVLKLRLDQKHNWVGSDLFITSYSFIL